MRADNSRHIIQAARNRHEYTRAKAVQALREIEAAGTPVTFDAVARAAKVSRSWLYSQQDLRTEIERLRPQGNGPAVHHSRHDSGDPTPLFGNGWRQPTSATVS